MIALGDISVFINGTDFGWDLVLIKVHRNEKLQRDGSVIKA